MELDDERFSRFDRPNEDASQDTLGRGRFVSDLATFIRDHDGRESLVIGLYGPWGSGKTSIINLLKQELDSGGWKAPILIVDYKPLSHVKDTELAADLIRTVRDSLERLPRNHRTKRAIAVGVRLLTGFARYASLGEDLVQYSSAQIKERRDSRKVWKLRDRIAVKLRNSPGKVVVFVDDIDQLDVKEARPLLRTIANVLDFPNTVFVLAFDYETVARSLTTLRDSRADDSIAKIVQFVVDVPSVDDDALADRILGQCLPDGRWRDFDGARLNDAIRLFLLGRVQTPREANRLVGAYHLRHASVGADTDPLDLLALTALEVVDHPLYQWIAAHRRELAGLWVTGDREKAVEAMRAKLERDLGDDRHMVTPWRFETRWRQLGYLFPRYGEDARGATRSTQPRTIADVNYVNRYFSDGLPTAAIRAEELHGLLDVARKARDEKTRRDLIRQMFELPLGVCSFSELITSKDASAEGTYAVHLDGLPEGLARNRLVELIEDAVGSPEFRSLPEDLQFATAVVYASLMDEEDPASPDPDERRVYERTARARLERWRSEWD